MSFNPFDLTGGPFLQLYGALCVVTFILGLVIPRWLRPEGQAMPLKDRDMLAYLAGGKNRLAETVVAGLMSRGALALEPPWFKIRLQGQGTSTAESGVLAIDRPARWSEVVKAATVDAETIEQKLVDRELLIARSETWQIRLLQTLPYLLLFAFGAIKWEVGRMRDKPVGFLTVLLVVTAIFAFVRFVALDRRTRGGQAVLVDAKVQGERLNRAPANEETALAVALFGTAVLASSGMADFHRLRTSSSGDSGSSSDGGGSGCGGGGGGCGGCGGG